MKIMKYLIITCMFFLIFNNIFCADEEEIADCRINCNIQYDNCGMLYSSQGEEYGNCIQDCRETRGDCLIFCGI